MTLPGVFARIHLQLLCLGLCMISYSASAQLFPALQAREAHRGQATIYFKDGTTRYTERVALGRYNVVVDRIGGDKLPAEMVEYIEVVKPNGELDYFVQANVQDLYWNFIPYQTWKWLEREWYSDRIEVFVKESIQYNAPSYDAFGNPIGFGPTQTRRITYFYRKDAGQMKRVRAREVVLDVADDPVALSIAEVGNNRKTTGWVLKTVGGAATLGGFYNVIIAQNQQQYINGLIITAAGAVTEVVGGFISNRGEDKLLEALQNYEQGNSFE